MATLSRKRQDLGYLAAEEGVAVLALQETRRISEQWRFRLSGYSSLESTASRTEAGRHGLALLVREDIGMYEVGEESGYWVFARLFGGPLATPWVVGTFYRPHAREAGREAWSGLRRQLRRLKQKHPADPILVVGDWNCRSEALVKRLERWRLGMVLARVRGSPRSFSRGSARGHRPHDHLGGARAPAGRREVMRAWDLADHWPIRASIDGRVNPLAGGGGRRVRCSVGCRIGRGPRRRSSGRSRRSSGATSSPATIGPRCWTWWRARRGFGGGPRLPLVMPTQAEALDAAAQAFTDTSFKVARELDLTAQVVRRPRCASRMCQRGTAARCASGCAPTGG